jgi:hypothetical protein
MAKKEEQKGSIELPALDFKQVTFKIEGMTPLIVNKFSEKASQMMLDKQMKKATKGKEAKNPDEQFEGSLYKFPDGIRTGFPAVGFKAAMVRGAKQLGIAMTDSRGKFHVLADDGDLIEINGTPEKRQDMVRLATGVADIRFRGEYKKWSANITITYNAGVISDEQLAQILKIAGFSCGIGEWRPEKSNSGSYGMFKIANEN